MLKRFIVAFIVSTTMSASHAAQTCDVNRDGDCSVADLLLLEQALSAPPAACKNYSFILGKGNDVFEPTTAAFALEWNVIATDLVGNAIQNGPIEISVRSLFFKKGFLQTDLAFGQWVNASANNPPIMCPDEDANQDGILTPTEDYNDSGQIEAGTVAIVAPVDPGAPSGNPCAGVMTGGTTAEVMTNGLGLARFCVIWPQNYSWWVDLLIAATATESCDDPTQAPLFPLPASPVDINDITTQPPHAFSPFGIEQDCAIPPPGLPLP